VKIKLEEAIELLAEVKATGEELKRLNRVYERLEEINRDLDQLIEEELERE